MKRVAIAGAGVSGLTCGVVLQHHGFDVTLFADEIEHTTSSVAAAIWYPYDISPDDFDQALAWALETYGTFRELAGDPATGVSMVTLTVRGEPRPEWAADLESRDVADGHELLVPLIETPIYLPWLRRSLRIEKRTLASLDDLTGDFDLVVNCTGLGARELCGDRTLHEGRGVVLRASPYSGPPMHIVSSEPELTYILTRRHDVILGGTNDALSHRDVAGELKAAIHARCTAIAPSLPRTFEHAVGFRPLRPTVRLERSGNVIHNYGHGGAGFTVSWAAARRVLTLSGAPFSAASPAPSR